MKNPDTPMVRRPGPRGHNHFQEPSLTPSTATPQIKSLPLAVEQRLFGRAQFASGLSAAFLSGCPPLVPDGGAP
jgi:hypothetical protein